MMGWFELERLGRGNERNRFHSSSVLTFYHIDN